MVLGAVGNLSGLCVDILARPGQIMRLISTTLAVMLWTGVAVAQDSGTEVMRPSVCMDGAGLETLTDRFDETPIARGIAVYPTPSSIVIFINVATGSFTVVERVATDRYCVLSVGGSFESVPLDIQKESQQRQQKGRL
jgi:hypothetical protein